VYLIHIAELVSDSFGGGIQSYGEPMFYLYNPALIGDV